MNLSKKNLLSLLFLGTLILAACGNGDENEGEDSAAESDSNGESVEIRMANLVSETNYQNQGALMLNDEFEEASDGDITMEIHSGASLATSDEALIDLLESGSIEMTSVSAYSVASPTGIDGFAIFDVPYLFDDREEYYELVDGEYGEELISSVEENENLNNVKVLGFLDQGFYGVLSANDAIEEPEDMQGLTIRSSPAPLQLSTLEALGANPTPLAYGEIYTGLQQGTIEGVSTSTPLFYADNFHEAADHVTLTNQIILAHVLLVNEDFYDGLSEENRETFDQVTEEYLAFYRDYILDVEAETLEGFEEEGIEIVELTSEQRERFEEETDTVIEENMEIVGQENYDRALELLGKQ
ncbi:TRAP transporter substrate-binding protein [Lacicoccus alkaliphilus]|uniref:Tripartite ATP-independent transporter solute receptor, DctP family n=1 Tax=Lacicoccus alkaliphilus DSM 16010 TaxID=1123231 RepID=A0A1M7CZ24_9BACL|nr:TRAP transporter substrate-binding protein [Salinicoccus alkaliphilus]SHL72363.1 tripartite ATP-independent transporter solute receptor, DctP family [Salinicoccus alkaliphilus DSM 16010]